MLSEDQRVAIADELFAADQSRGMVERLTKRYPDMEVADSYAVQSIWAQRRLDAGYTIVGHKIGLTSKVMQLATGITEPDYGVIFDDMVWPSGAEIEHGLFSNVRIEVELAYVLKKDLTGPNCTLEDVIDAVDYVVPALEILNSHIEMDGRTIVDTISDNAAMGGMVVGDTHKPIDFMDLRWAPGILMRNGDVEETGLAAGVLNNPPAGVFWLANKLAQHGTVLKAGEIILAGSFTKPMWVHPGDHIVADFGPLGVIECRFI